MRDMESPMVAPKASRESDQQAARGFHKGRSKVERAGILLSPLSDELGPEAFVSLLKNSLKPLVLRACSLPNGQKEREGRIGDFRFLIVEFARNGGFSAFVQIWSEPDCDVVVEVGPGEREDSALQAFCDQVSGALNKKGLHIGGGARNFRMAVPVRDEDAADRLAADMADLLVHDLAYDGNTEVAYHIVQSSHLWPSHVTQEMSLEALTVLLNAWGLNAIISADQPDCVDIQGAEITFLAQLAAPVRGRAGSFWEVHLLGQVTVSEMAAGKCLAEVNERQWLMKAFTAPARTSGDVVIRIAMGINLAGGVTQGHVKAQVLEWVKSLRYFSRTWTEVKTRQILTPDPEIGRSLH